MGYIMDLRKAVGSKPLIMVGACVIVRNEQGHVLLQKRTDTLDWGTLGGSLELGESMEDAAERELFEEAGLTAEHYQFITLLSGADMYFRYPHGDEIYNVTGVYEAEGVSGTPTINDDESSALQYFSLDQPIPGLNPLAELILSKSGYMK